ncbi:mannose-1-phosphate guanylyltransferase/mannose-6-phosphate isomerase [Prochlorococcus marinus XMU1411]|uniref:mannose-1-phosphate guanylyltransferase/mannose-6-phosphate isomerase n=1 Tax=Prochlorococcus marinus TaxID=1219 RepID=UPI001ADC290F|nr:mannose-1-phosphate guanylyltransferase/mannose-6-phosphate isomerase [Prochlorococcus marinus]MBO8244196.1 mannose-1-phosphate guanylyltransferase/mannose-6-phosphate isomerase [Prochlorococcus marinus XMU1411]MBW3055281.1 mannose-1-phosphate guanylyltransferase/mannose-6-phosphate isomerase [Prochlorococcus marinus str. MU1411]MCR8537024.1 mannose-1-phosphate guanylyltransferase/mannose-6-phosphate isomerase [Prochlorococcus marinus CUG1430]
MSENEIFPVILCGGKGSRLWPLSRQSFPKQFLSICSEDRKSLLQQTYERISTFENIKPPIIICNEEHRFIVAEQMREINIVPSAIILEPYGRNTAPAIAISTLFSLKLAKNPTLLVLSSDHIIKNEMKFREAIKVALKFSQENKIVTFGVIPTSPETGYGYIKSKEPFNLNKINGIDIMEFIEKPTLNKAKALIKDKFFTWNSGIFVSQAITMINEMSLHCPELLDYCKESVYKSEKDLDFIRLNKESFEKCPNISIDIAVMEKTKIGTVIPLNAGWSDIGSWDTVLENAKKDSFGNFSEGRTLIRKTKNSYLSSNSRLLVSLGLEDTIVIETTDAILVANRNFSQDIKNIVEELCEKNMPEGQANKKVYRPWGSFISLEEHPNWQVKLLTIKPGEKLSLQMHQFRSEHWIVVEGQARIEIGDKSLLLSKNQSTYIPKKTKHRIHNAGKVALNVIEVQSGTYLGEDDIIRFEDNYGRNS